MSRNELPVDGDWESVHVAVRRLMERLDMSLSRLSRESGVSETTIRYLKRPEKRQRSTLVALSAALGCPHDYLVDVLSDAADPEAPLRSPADATMLGSMTEKLDGLREVLYSIDSKVEVILRRQE